MSMNLIESVKGAFTNDFISKTSALFNETEGGISKALTAAVPAFLLGIISNASADGGSNVSNLGKQAVGSGLLGNLGGVFSGGSSTSSLLSMGSNMLSGILGNRVGNLSSIISGFSGIKQSSINSLLSAIAPIALGFIGKYALSNNLSSEELLNWLNEQKSSIAGAVPAGLNLAGLPGEEIAKAGTAIQKPTEPAPGAKWLWPLLLAIAAIALLWYLMRGCGKEADTIVTADTTAVTSANPEPVVNSPTSRITFKVILPDGSELDAYKAGIEDQLVTFLTDKKSKPGNDLWFDFDNLNFKKGTAEIVPESQKQLNNLASILNAFPKVKIKIGGYTDKAGNEAANRKLSQSRANAIRAELVAAGVGKQIVGAQGYGSEFAKAEMDAPESDRMKDRRISISVRAK